jgi:hypothetical protein
VNTTTEFVFDLVQYIIGAEGWGQNTVHSVNGNVSQKVINMVTYTRQNNIKTELKDTGSEDVTQAAEVHVKW